MTPIVLIHGGGFDGRCWERLLPHLCGAAIAVDLPGRGAHLCDLAEVSFAACAEAVRSDIDAAGFDEVVLVGHSLAGCSMPAVISVLGERVRHAVFVAATVPPHGKSAFDTLDASIQEMIHRGGGLEPAPMPPEIAKIVLGSDLTEEQFAWCVERMVIEAVSLTTESVDLSPLPSSLPRTWVRTLHDIILTAEKQLDFAMNVGSCPVIDIDAGHMCMVSRPEALARILNEIAAC